MSDSGISRRLTPEECDKLIKEANRDLWEGGHAWLDRQLEKLKEEGKEDENETPS